MERCFDCGSFVNEHRAVICEQCADARKISDIREAQKQSTASTNTRSFQLLCDIHKMLGDDKMDILVDSHMHGRIDVVVAQQKSMR